MIKKDFERVTCIIYELSKIENKPVYFQSILKKLSELNDYNKLTYEQQKSIVSRNVDVLFDCALVKGNWEKVDGNWLRVFSFVDMAEPLIKHIYWDKFVKNITLNLDNKSKAFIMDNFDIDKNDCFISCKSLYKNIEEINQLLEYDLIVKKSKNENNQPNHFGYSITTTGKSVMASIKSNEPKDEIVFKK